MNLRLKNWLSKREIIRKQISHCFIHFEANLMIWDVSKKLDSSMSCISAFMVAIKYRDIWPSCCGDRRCADSSSSVTGVHFCSQLGVSNILSGNVQLRGGPSREAHQEFVLQKWRLIDVSHRDWKSMILREIISLAMRPRSEHEVESCYWAWVLMMISLMFHLQFLFILEKKNLLRPVGAGNKRMGKE